MARTPAVSVCIRASDRPPELLRAAIASVLAQTFSDFEVIVSDDSGRLGPVVRDFRDERLRYEPNPRSSGSVANMTRVLNLARAPLLAPLDDDDVWLPDFLATVVDAFARDPDAGVVFTDHYLEVSGRRVPRAAPIAPGRHDTFLPAVLEHWPVVLGSAMVRREVWRQVEREYPLRSGTIADITLWLAAASAGWPFHYVDRPLAVWRQHAGQMTWRDEIPARNIATLERFRFADPAAERLRRGRLAEARAAKAGVLLRAGRVREARREIARARRDGPGQLGVRAWMAFTDVRSLVMRAALWQPAVVLRGIPLWRRVRPPVSR